MIGLDVEPQRSVDRFGHLQADRIGHRSNVSSSSTTSVRPSTR